VSQRCVRSRTCSGWVVRRKVKVVRRVALRASRQAARRIARRSFPGSPAQSAALHPELAAGPHGGREWHVENGNESGIDEPAAGRQEPSGAAGVRGHPGARRRGASVAGAVAGSAGQDQRHHDGRPSSSHRRRWSTPFATSSVAASSIAADDANVVRLVLAPATALDGFLRCVTGVGKLGSAAGVGG
jgi:hypothetical protein